MNLRTRSIILAIVLIVSFITKLIDLGSNPAGFFADEASVGYDAFLLATTGRDRNNDRFPLFFKGFNFDNISPYQVYFTVPAVILGRLNETSVRLPPVIGSTVELLLFYFLLRLFLPEIHALFGTVFLSISPWHFHISRVHFGDFYTWTLFSVGSILFFSRFLRNKTNQDAIYTAVFLALTSYSYTPARLTTPILFGFLLLVIVLQKLFKQAVLISIVYIILLIPFINFHVKNPYSFQRIKDTVSVDVNNTNVTEPLVIMKSMLPKFTKKYAEHYSDEFLYTKGDADYPGQFIKRHSISGIGLLYPYQKLFLILGFLYAGYIVVKRKQMALLSVFFLFFLFPIPDSLTQDNTPFSTRSYLGVLPAHIFIAFGFYLVTKIFLSYIPRYSRHFYIFVGYTGILLTILSGFILYQFFRLNPLTTSDFWGWQFGARDIMAYFVQHHYEYDELIMEPAFNGPKIFLKFYDPEGRCSRCKIGFLHERYDANKNQLFAVTSEELLKVNQPLYVRDRIYAPDSSVRFFLVSNRN